MGHDVFHPRTAERDEKRQANEALGRSFCKTLAEPITNSDSSAKRKLGISHASGLVDLMLAVPKGTQMDTSALREKLVGKYPKRVIVVEVVTARASGRQVGEIVVIDQAQGMSAATLKTALFDIAGDRMDLAGGVAGRNLFGRGLSDVMRAHSIGASDPALQPLIETYDGKQLTRARGEWRPKEGWTIDLTYNDGSPLNKITATLLDPASTGTAVRFVISNRARNQGCRIPDPPQIVGRLANFYILRLIASDPNVELRLRQHRTQGTMEDRIEFDFPVGQVIERFTRAFYPQTRGLAPSPLSVDFLVVRSDSQHPLPGSGPDRDARERGLLIVDDLDAVYDLTFADPDYEKADFLEHIYGIVRVNGLHDVLVSYLNAESPSSPLRPDREGFNREHEFARDLLAFLAEHLRPVYEKERRIVEEKEHAELSSETKKRIDDALKHLNKYFQRITELAGEGTGPGSDVPSEPKDPMAFFPQHTKLIAGRQSHVLLLIREDSVKSGAEVLTEASDGLAVQPETEQIDKKESPRWYPRGRLSPSGTNGRPDVFRVFRRGLASRSRPPGGTWAITSGSASRTYFRPHRRRSGGTM